VTKVRRWPQLAAGRHACSTPLGRGCPSGRGDVAEIQEGTEQNRSLAFDEHVRGMSMPSSQLKRAERAIQSIRDQAELPPETADALDALVDVIRTIEGRLSALERKGHPHPTKAMALANSK
jgi:hypothetical protein